jgi:hypothetical protein
LDVLLLATIALAFLQDGFMLTIIWIDPRYPPVTKLGGLFGAVFVAALMATLAYVALKAKEEAE